MRHANRCLLLGLGLLALAACAAETESMDQPVAIGPEQLQPAQGESGAWTYIDPDADLKKYTSFILARPTVFRGKGSDYPKSFSQQELDELAEDFANETRAALAPKYPVVTEAGPDVARLQFTLIGVTQTVPYVSTATRIIPFGAALNLVKGAAGAGGTLTGSVTYAIQAFDSQSDKVVAAAVRRLTPGAFDLSSTLGTKETAHAVAKDAAAKLRARLDSMHGA